MQVVKQYHPLQMVIETMLPWTVKRRPRTTPGSSWDHHRKAWLTQLLRGDEVQQEASLSREQIDSAEVVLEGRGTVYLSVSVGDVSWDDRLEVLDTTTSGLRVPSEYAGLRTLVRVKVRVVEGEVSLLQVPLWERSESSFKSARRAVNVVMVNYQRARLAADLVRYIHERLDRCNCDFEVFVVDNDSGDDSLSILAKERCTVLSSSVNGGGSGGLRLGIPESLVRRPSDLVWVLDDDVYLRPDTFYHLLRAVEDGAGVAGSLMMQMDSPHLIHEYGGFIAKDGGLHFNEHGVRFAYTDRPKRIQVDFVAGASLLIRRDVIDTCGYQPDWFIHFDDVEWCARIRQAGYSVVAVADSIIWHQSGKVKPATWVRYYDVRNHLKFLEMRNPAKLHRWLKKFRLEAWAAWVRGRAPDALNIEAAIEDWRGGVESRGRAAFPPLQKAPFSLVHGVALVSWALLNDPLFLTALHNALNQADFKIITIGLPRSAAISTSRHIQLEKSNSRIGYLRQLWALRGKVDVVLTGVDGYMRLPWLASDRVLVMLSHDSGYLTEMPLKQWVRGLLSRAWVRLAPSINP